MAKDGVQFHHMPYRQQALENVNDKLNVPLVKAYMGMPGDIFSFYSREGIDGMVIEALGQGNIPSKRIRRHSTISIFKYTYCASFTFL
ncbi:hypothetical protein ACVXZZ_15215 [Staphylococcus aureus]